MSVYARKTESDALLGGGAAVDSNGETSPVLIDWEARKQRRLCFSLFAGTAFLALVGIIAVWDAERRAFTRLVNHDVYVAEESLKKLNKKYASAKVPTGCETTVLLMRHCEKHGPYVTDEQGNEHCSYIGYERAEYLASLFGNTPYQRWPAPSHLFALSPDRSIHWNFREWETLQPLSKKIGLVIEVFGKNDIPEIYFELLASGALCGRLVVISWKHEYLPGLALSLGCGPDDGCPPTFNENEFDEVWQLKYIYRAPPIDQKENDAENSIIVKNGTATIGSLIGENALIEGEGGEAADAGHSSTAAAGDNAGGNNNNNNNRRLQETERMLHQNEQRMLKGGRKHKDRNVKHGWNVFASVTKQNFDPLEFSKNVGDYPEGGTNHGGRWGDEV